MTMDAPKRLRRRFQGLALLLSLAMLAYAFVQYTKSDTGELTAYCAEPAAGVFSLKLACIPQRP
jgi:hypothetical protein